MSEFKDIITHTRQSTGLSLRSFAAELSQALPPETPSNYMMVNQWEHGMSKPSYLMAHLLWLRTPPGDWRHEMAIAILREYAPEIWREPKLIEERG